MKEYIYFVSFQWNDGKDFGTGWRILTFKIKPTLTELDKALYEHNPKFNQIAIISFKLLDPREIDLSDIK